MKRSILYVLLALFLAAGLYAGLIDLPKTYHPVTLAATANDVPPEHGICTSGNLDEEPSPVCEGYDYSLALTRRSHDDMVMAGSIVAVIIVGVLLRRDYKKRASPAAARSAAAKAAAAKPAKSAASRRT